MLQITDEARAIVYLGITVCSYLAMGVCALGVFARYGRWAYTFWMVLASLLAGLLWGAGSLDESYPAHMRWNTGLWAAFVSSIGMILPLSLGILLKRPVAKIGGLIVAVVVTVPSVLYIVLATSFRGV